MDIDVTELDSLIDFGSSVCVTEPASVEEAVVVSHVLDQDLDLVL